MDSGIWEKTISIIQKELKNQGVEAWLKLTKFLDYSQDEIVIGVLNNFLIERLSQYKGLFEEVLERLNQKPTKIRFVVSKEISLDNNIEDTTIKTTPKNGFRGNPKYTFENFVVGESNRFAHAACLAVSKNPSKTYNPLFIYGGVGLGKTHLMHAIGQAVEKDKNKKGLKIFYTSTEQFTNEFIDSITQGKPLTGFRNKYRNIDILLIDDIHFLAGKESTQMEFFHTFNTLYESHRQIVISSDRPPKEIPTLEERLRSRFECGLITDIQPPDFETRYAILKKKAESGNIKIQDDVIYFIASRIKYNIRELEGALIRVVAYSSLKNRPIDLPLARDILKDVLVEEKEGLKHISIDLIQRKVAKYFKLSPNDMKVKKRNVSVSFPRQIAMYLSRELTNCSLPEIGREFGGRDHTTVMYAYEKIKNRIKDDPDFNKEIDKIINELRDIV
ncbi:MAG: chromosomal replication initiator protein DnaA [bacterium]|nr:chromosomal replication initiator protein DnaA [bacterium]